MIIYIDESIAQKGKQEEMTFEEKVMFTQLACSHISGDCYLTGDDSSIKWLREKMPDYFGPIKGHHSELGILIDAVEVVVVLSYNDTAEIKMLQGKSRVITIEEALSYRLSERCSLLGENRNDCAFYNLLAVRYMNTRPGKMRGTMLSFKKEAGGGSTSHTAFEECVEGNKNLTLCLVDSDIKYGPTERYPDQKKGDTLKKLIDVKNRLEKTPLRKIFEVYDLPVHEAENLIPISVLRDIANTSVPEMRKGVAFLEKLLQAEKTEAMLYYDFKNGGNKVKTDPSFNYWYGIGLDIDDVDFPPLCSGVLEKAIGYLSQVDTQGNIQVTVVSLDNYLIPLWNTIGSKVYTWGCASKPIRC